MVVSVTGYVGMVDRMATPGAATSALTPEFEKLALAPFWSVAMTERQSCQYAGSGVFELEPSLPMAHTGKALLANAKSSALCSVSLRLLPPRERLITRAPCA